MKITSRNVNGIRAVMKKWFLQFLQSDNPDILCLQETKAFVEQMPEELSTYLATEWYDYCRHAGTRAGYAGTAIFWRKSAVSDVVSCNTFADNEMFYEDGRVTELNFTKDGTAYTLLNGYFPNWWTRADGTEMLTYKLAFYDCLIEYIQYKRASGRKMIVVGDYNIVHTEIDIARPKENQNTIWFLPVEREKVSEFLTRTDMIDVFRHFHPDKLDEYTWWSMRAGARPRNVWRRIDYATVSSDLLDQVTDFAHQQSIMGSDHCPVSIIF